MNTSGMKRKTAVRLLCVAIILALISCLGAAAIQTSFGKVEVSDFSVPADGGRTVAGKLYLPVGAGADNQVPLVITCHGYLNNNEMQDMAAVELSRRGIAVMAMDAYFHGSSSSTDVSVIESCMADGTGMIPLVEYAYNELDYVAKDKIGVMGHSMGGMNVWMTLVHYGAQYYTALAAAMSPESEGGEEITPEEQAAAEALNKVNAGLASGFIALANKEICSAIRANFAINYSYYDEGNYATSTGSGDMSAAAEALATVNSIMPEGEKLEAVEPGRYYGSAADRTLRAVFNPKGTHQTQHFSTTAAADDVGFFLTAFGMEDSIPTGSQTWLAKELFNALGIVAVLLAIVPMAALLLDSRVFSCLRREVPAKLPAPRTGKQKAIFWGGFILSALISWLSFIPVASLDMKLFPRTAAMATASVFPQQGTNFIMLWAVFNGLVGLLLFWLSRKLDGESVSPELRGIRISASDFLRTLALAVCVFIGFYAFVFLAEYFFNTDYRFWMLAICDFSADKLLILLEYLPFYFIFFAANAIATNSIYRVEGQREGFNLFLCGLNNIFGVLMVNMIQYISLFGTGNALYGEARLYPMTALPLIVLLFVAAYINRALFKLTGKVWLGAMVNCLIILMISVANTATLLPL